MACWKARVEFLLSVIELLFLSLTVEALQGKTCQDSLLSGEGRSVRAKISGGRGRPWGIFFGFYQTGHILLSDSANCTVIRAVVLTQYRRVTDGQTDGQTHGIAIASTPLAMRALRRAVKILSNKVTSKHTSKSSVVFLQKILPPCSLPWRITTLFIDLTSSDGWQRMRPRRIGMAALFKREAMP